MGKGTRENRGTRVAGEYGVERDAGWREMQDGEGRGVDGDAWWRGTRGEERRRVEGDAEKTAT